jgi:hypothetical protein
MYNFKLFHSTYKRLTQINVIYLSNLKSCFSKNKLQKKKIKLFIKN